MRVLGTVWLLAAWTAFAGRAAAGPEEAAADERLVRAAKVGVEGPALLDFLRRRSTPPARKQVRRLLRQLADSAQGKADRAAGELVSLGTAVLPYLKEALADPAFAETKPRIENCLKWLEGPERRRCRVPLCGWWASASRRAPSRRCWPSSPRPRTRRLSPRWRTVLAALALRGGKPDPVLLDAITRDADATRRTVAAELAWLRQPLPMPLSCGHFCAAQRRCCACRLARAPAEIGAGEAIPVLIALLADLPRAQADETLALLRRLAAPLGPAVTMIGNGPDVQRSAATPGRNGGAGRTPTRC